MATVDNNLIDPGLGLDYARPETFVSVSPAMRALRKAMENVASSEVPVLILGEPGTGKRALALQIHQQSSRSHETFSEVDCDGLGPDSFCYTVEDAAYFRSSLQELLSSMKFRY